VSFTDIFVESNGPICALETLMMSNR
jgi:hypothetical protein